MWGSPRRCEPAEAQLIAAALRRTVNLTGVSNHEVVRGQALVRPGQWAPTRTFDGSLLVLNTVGHEVSRRGAYQVYLGSGEHAANLRRRLDVYALSDLRA